MWVFFGLVVVGLLLTVPGFYKIVLAVAGFALLAFIAVFGYAIGTMETDEQSRSYGSYAQIKVIGVMTDGLGKECDKSLSDREIADLTNQYINKLKKDHEAMKRLAATVKIYENKRTRENLFEGDWKILCAPFAEEMTDTDG